MLSILILVGVLLFHRTSGDDLGELPVVLGHRGSAGAYPEHTVLAYEKGAEVSDYIECDVQITRDLQLVCSHEAWIKEVCDVENFPQFLDRKNTYNMDDDDPNFDWNDKGDIKDNFFAFDFDLKELKMLKRRQVRSGRDPNYDFQYSFVDFDEFVSIAKSMGVGIAPEIKSPTAVNKILSARGKNVTVEDLVLSALEKHGYTKAEDKCLLQSFELSPLERIKGRTDVKRVFNLKRLSKTTSDVLERIKNADVYSVCLDKHMIVPTNEKGNCEPTNQDLVDRIHELGMKVYAYTFANEVDSFCWDYMGEVYQELEDFRKIGLDGYFTDYPHTARSYLDTLKSVQN